MGRDYVVFLADLDGIFDSYRVSDVVRLFAFVFYDVGYYVNYAVMSGAQFGLWGSFVRFFDFYGVRLYGVGDRVIFVAFVGWVAWFYAWLAVASYSWGRCFFSFGGLCCCCLGGAGAGMSVSLCGVIVAT